MPRAVPVPAEPIATASADVVPGLDSALCFALYAASHAMTRLYKPLLAPLGLTYPQYLVMVALWHQDAQTVSGLGEHLELDSGTLTPLLKRLEAQGTLTRQRDAQDERRVIVRLSPAGRKLKLRARAIPAAMARAAGCGRTEIDTLVRHLGVLRAALAEAETKAAPPH